MLFLLLFFLKKIVKISFFYLICLFPWNLGRIEEERHKLTRSHRGREKKRGDGTSKDKLRDGDFVKADRVGMLGLGAPRQ